MSITCVARPSALALVSLPRDELVDRDAAGSPGRPPLLHAHRSPVIVGTAVLIIVVCVVTLSPRQSAGAPAGGSEGTSYYTLGLSLMAAMLTLAAAAGAGAAGCRALLAPRVARVARQ